MRLPPQDAAGGTRALRSSAAIGIHLALIGITLATDALEDTDSSVRNSAVAAIGVAPSSDRKLVTGPAQGWPRIIFRTIQPNLMEGFERSAQSSARAVRKRAEERPAPDRPDAAAAQPGADPAMDGGRSDRPMPISNRDGSVGHTEPALAQVSDDSDARIIDPVERLRRELAQRDALIADLLARVEELERHDLLTAVEMDQIIAGGAEAFGSDERRPKHVGGADRDPNGEDVRASPLPVPAAKPVAAEEPATAQGSAAAPGRLEVDSETERALERTLVRTGALLLPFGQAESEPTFSYARREADAPTFFFENGTTFVGTSQVRQNEFDLSQELRFGLPFDSQLEVAFSYLYIDQSTVMKVGMGERAEHSADGQGPGDLSIGFAKTLLRENGKWWPDVVGRIAWDTGTGKTIDGPVVLGGGFSEVRGSLSATKRQDPLAFIGSLSYETSFENDHVDPGDEIGLALGAVLAASPESSLRAVLSHTFIQETEFDGRSIDGSDRVVGTLTLGGSSILGRGILLDLASDIGLTDDGVEYALRASLPIRFSLPVF
jgi:hypothetical protein